MGRLFFYSFKNDEGEDANEHSEFAMTNFLGTQL